MKKILFICMFLLGGICDRLGGIKYTKIRDFGVPLCSIVALYALGITVSWWIYIVYFVLAFASHTTYFDHWGSDGVDFWEWVLTGFFRGFSALPIAVVTGCWIGFILRCFVLAAFMPFSNKLQLKIFKDKTDGVEGSRGVMFILTLPLLLI